MVEEFKIVMHIKGQTAMVGISRAGCDPVFFTTDSPLTVMLGGIPGFLERAEEQWKEKPRYPQSDLPETPSSPVRTAAVPVRSTPAKPAEQNAMF